MRSLKVAAIALILLGLQACTESITDPPDIQTSVTCQQGCVEVDSFPSSPGIFLGSGVTEDLCFEGQTDADADGLSDFCEKNLAEAFAPEMFYNNTDDIRRESYWAAKPNGTFVRVFYALAYYFDLGLTGFDYSECKAVSLWELLGECDGHHGDSEYVVLDLYYQPSTRHWLLHKAYLSRHEDPLPVSRTGIEEYPGLFEYPVKAGGYPRVYVARRKHANYPTRKTCNAGGGLPWPLIELFPWDDCQANSAAFRPRTGQPYNLGARFNRPWAQDCEYSDDPFNQDPPRRECFWSGNYFYGWQIDQTTHSTGYTYHLADYLY